MVLGALALADQGLHAGGQHVVREARTRIVSDRVTLLLVEDDLAIATCPLEVQELFPVFHSVLALVLCFEQKPTALFQVGVQPDRLDASPAAVVDVPLDLGETGILVARPVLGLDPARVVSVSYDNVDLPQIGEVVTEAGDRFVDEKC